jgi:hypothetical protein
VAAITTAIAHPARVLGGGRLGYKPRVLRFSQYADRFVNVYQSSHFILDIKPCHGPEHNTGFDGFIATFVHDFLSLPTEAFGDGDSIIFLNDRDRVIKRSHVVFRDNGLLYRDGAKEKPVNPRYGLIKSLV